jgi:hypothetical protein
MICRLPLTRPLKYAALLLITAVPALSQFDGLIIPNCHPVLWYGCDADRISTARAWVRKNPFAPGGSGQEEQAQLALHGFLTNNAGECRAAVAWAAQQTLNSSEYSPTANGSDASRNMGEQIAFIYDLCYDHATQAQRDRIRGNWVGIYLPGINQQKWGGPRMVESNYNWGNFRNDLLFGLATYHDNAGAAKALLDDALTARWTANFVPHAATTGRGGVAQEGSGYGAYMLDYAVPGFATAALLGRDLMKETDFFKGSVFYLIYATQPALTHAAGGGANWNIWTFSDDQFFPGARIAGRDFVWANFMGFAAQHWRNLPVGQYARRWLKMTAAQPDLYIRSTDSGGPSLPFSSLPLDYYAPGIGHYFGRSAWGPKATTFNLQMGMPFGVGHYHEEWGNWQMWRNGYWLTRETASYSDTFKGYNHTGVIGSRNAPAHNTLYFNGAGFADSNGRVGFPVVRRLEYQKAYAYANVDLTAAYRNSDTCRPTDNPAVGHAERDFIFVRSLETLVILDRLDANNVRRLCGRGPGDTEVVRTFFEHCEVNWTVEDPNHLVCRRGRQVLRTTILLPPPPAVIRAVNESCCDKCSKNGQYRLEVDAAGAAQTYFLTVHQARSVSDANVAASMVDSDPGSGNARRGTFTVTLHPARGGDTIIVFRKGTISSGGTIVTGGASFSLRSGVQGIAVSDTGPAWQP